VGVSVVEDGPAGVQAPVGCLAAGAACRGRDLPAPSQIPPRPIPGSVMPGRFDQQAAGMAVTVLVTPPRGACRPRGVLRGHQPQVSADRAPAQALPVPDTSKLALCATRPGEDDLPRELRLENLGR
jgi:hypothetical protein